MVDEDVKTHALEKEFEIYVKCVWIISQWLKQKQLRMEVKYATMALVWFPLNLSSSLDNKEGETKGGSCRKRVIYAPTSPRE